MDWKKFKEIEKDYPENVIGKLITGFSNATDGLLDIYIEELDEFLTGKLGAFQFRMILTSNSLSKYKFEILKFGYNVELYPVKIKTESSIYQAITGLPSILADPIRVENEEDLENVIREIFESKRFEEIVSGLMKISKKY